MKSRNSILFYIFAAGTLLLDQISKYLARGILDDRPVTVIPGFFELKLVFNNGAAFGILPNWAPLFVIVGIVAIWAIIKLKDASKSSLPLAAGLGLLLGGALGNMIDRISSHGHVVTDFLSFHISLGGNAHEWPTFNLADAAIVIGALLIFIHVYIIEKRREQADDEQQKHDEQ